MFTLITLERQGSGQAVPVGLSEDDDLAYFHDRTLGDLMAAEQRATAETLVANGCPLRLFHLEILDEVSLGALLMHFMVETIITAGIMGIDPFDQPAVDDGKVRARAYLADGSQQ